MTAAGGAGGAGGVGSVTGAPSGTAVVLFTRDLRVHDNPALAAACRHAATVVPVFVHDPALRVGEGRRRFLAECLSDLRSSLRSLGGDLVELRGDPVDEVMRVVTSVGADRLAVAADVSGYARRRERRLAAACAGARVGFASLPGVTVVPPGALHPAAGDHYRVFTPYWRVWRGVAWRPVSDVPGRVPLPDRTPPGLPAGGGADGGVGGGVGGGADGGVGGPAGGPGGEAAGRERLRRWLHRIDGYAEGHDDLAADHTSRLSPYLHFGCVSPLEVARAAVAREGPGAEAFLRQLCWRDFYQQVLHAFPDLTRKPYRPGSADHWGDDPALFDAWREGRTGVPLVDAGMRQLAAEGWMHNRARLVTASYLTKNLGQDWRAGAEHFMELLLDADVANNYGNWQWVAGTGNDTRPYRRFNPDRQAERYDPHGSYRRRHLPAGWGDRAGG